MTEILHVVPGLSLGGAGRSLLALCAHSRGTDLNDRIATLAAADGGAARRAARAGIEVIATPGADRLAQLVSEADIVHVHYWNTPSMWEVLGHDLPPARILLWLKVHGSNAPQVLTRELLDYGDAVLATSPSTCRLDVWRDAEQRAGFDGSVAPGIADFARTAGFCRRPHVGFNVGYVGSVDYVKMHPRFLAMHDAIDVPEARFIVCGDGAAAPRLAKELRTMAGAARFELRGYVEDVRSVLESLDVFGYPLTPDTYATSEKSLQEAMIVGIPPVVFPHAGLVDLVEDGATGLVVTSEADYARAVESLHRRPDLRARLGENAARYAQRAFDPRHAVATIHATYRRLLSRPRRRRAAPAPLTGGAAQFVASLGHRGRAFATSRTGSDPNLLLAAERTIAHATPVLCNSGAGGVFHYRAWYPDDPHLRLWAGLILHQQGRPALALAELRRAQELGLQHWRMSRYVAAAARAAGAMMVEREAAARLRREAPPGFGDLG